MVRTCGECKHFQYIERRDEWSAWDGFCEKTNYYTNSKSAFADSCDFYCPAEDKSLRR